jgi:chemotaxis protein MotB
MTRFFAASGRLFGIVPLLLFATGCTGKYKELLAERDNQIQALKTDKAALEGDVEKLRGNEDVLQRQIAAEKNRADGLNGQVSRLQSDLQKPAPKVAAGSEEGDLEKTLGGGIDVQRRKEGIALILPASVTFASGSADLTKTGQGNLKKIGDLLRARYKSRAVSVDGHTDTQPIQKSKYGTNWRLSTERALSVAQYLEKGCGVDPKRLRVVGHGQFQPIASNGNQKGMQANRRVEVLILN